MFSSLPQIRTINTMSAKKHLRLVGEQEVYLGAFALFEFDITLKSRGFTFEERMEKYALLLRDYPLIDRKLETQPFHFLHDVKTRGRNRF